MTTQTSNKKNMWLHVSTWFSGFNEQGQYHQQDQKEHCKHNSIVTKL